MTPPDLVRLTDSTRRLVRTVDTLDETALAAPSLLPGWTRSHVVAHLALDAEAMARAAEGARGGHQVPLYDSPESRTADIEDLARVGCSELRERFLGSTARFADVAHALTGRARDTEVAWVPGGPRRPLGELAAIRRGEVEVHHADLGSDTYDRTDWPGDFCAWVLDARSAGVEVQPAFTAYAGDLDRRWSFGGGHETDPVVTGPASALAWWAAGRGSAEDIECDGPLPRISAW